MASPDNCVIFSVRLSKEDKRLLDTVARLRETKPAVLSRQFIVEGIHRALDPAEICRQADEEKERLLAAAQTLREAFPTALDQ